MRRNIFLAVALTFGYSNQANAGILNATETVTGSGVLDGTPFTNALVALTGTFNTNTFVIDTNNGFAQVSLTADPTVTVGGVSDTLTGRSLDTNNGSVFDGPFDLDSTALSERGTVFSGADVGFEGVVLILSTSNATANYATVLQGPGATTGTAGIDPGIQFATSSGQYFELDSKSSDATFTISGAASPVPEPGSLTIAVIGAVSVALGAWRKRCRQEA